MISALLAIFMLLLTINANASDTSFWRNAEQRGEDLLRQGDASAAAKVFTDPRRKAYAKIQAGNYKEAAADLANYQDSESSYNRGNALAYEGDLQSAIDAYDAVLKNDPNHTDARHNRELVAKALEQQSPQQSDSSDEQRDKQPNNNNQDQQDQNQQTQDPSGSGKDEKNRQGNQDKQDQNGKEENDKKEHQDSANEKQKQETQDKQHNTEKSDSGQADSEQNKPSQDQDKQKDSTGQHEQKSAADNQGQPGQAPDQTGKRQQTNVADDAEQARRDAEASLALSGEQKNNGSNNNEKNDNSVQAEAPLSEQQLALEQWLRNIPDDPGGLLRRKFLIEHMMRQQNLRP